MRIRKFFVALMMAAAPILAFANSDTIDTDINSDTIDTDISNTVPEPETLALLAVGAVALLIARKNKRK